MEIRVPWGLRERTVEVDPDRLAEIVRPNRVESVDEFETLCGALVNPIGTVSFKEFIRGGGEPLFIVNDGTRPTPTAKVLDIIEDDLAGCEPSFIIATGVHRAPTEEELRFIFGCHLERYRDRIHVHDSRTDRDMVRVGTTARGTEIRLNRRVVEADRLVIIGSVEPHSLSGYTGGRKSILPGVASYRTIEQNHSHALSPASRALVLEGNPVHEDMLDTLRVFSDKPLFSLQTVLDRERRIYAAVAGDVNRSFHAAVGKAREVFCVDIVSRADVVVSICSHPMDVDLYQSQKALHNGALALAEGGVLILVSRCSGGIGHDTFHRLLSSCSTLKDVLVRIEEGYVLGYHIAAKMAKIGSWARMWAVTELPDDVVRECHMRPFDTVQAAVDEALSVKGPTARVLFLMDGCITVPLPPQ